MKPIERLFQYLEYHGVKPTSAERDFGLSNGYLALTLKRKGDIGSQIVEKILNKCHNFKQIKKAVIYCLDFHIIGSVPSSLSTILISKSSASNIRIIVENLGVY